MSELEVVLTGRTEIAGGQLTTPSPYLTLSTFAQDTDGCIGFHGYAFRSAIRECLIELGFFQEHPELRRHLEGVPTWTMAHALTVLPQFIRLERNGQPLLVPDEVTHRPVLARIDGKLTGDCVAKDAVVHVPWQAKAVLHYRRPITQDVLEKALAYLQFVGLGGLRSRGYGRAEVCIAG
jgi:hypothetical protein